MKIYKAYYWLNAILAKNFGKSIAFKRDSLHSIYKVNRHSFEVIFHDTDLVYDWLHNYLINHEWKKNQDQSFCYFEKQYLHNKICIYICKQSNYYGTQKTLNISLFNH